MDPEAVRLELLCDPAPTSAGLQGDVGDTPLPALHPDAEAVARALEALVPGHARLRIQRGGLEHGLVMIDRGVHDVFGLRFEFLYRHYGGLTEAPSLHPDRPAFGVQFCSASAGYPGIPLLEGGRFRPARLPTSCMGRCSTRATEDRTGQARWRAGSRSASAHRGARVLVLLGRSRIASRPDDRGIAL